MAVLEVRELVKHYPGVRAVDGISFAIEEGSCFGLLGPNGAGKTTTLECIEDIHPPTGGEILYRGRPRGREFRNETGIQLQTTELFSKLTVRETLETFRNLYPRRMDFDELTELCALGELLDRDNQKISGGQKQRLLLAMALCNDPDLIFLDEPTTGLDPQARRHLWDIVRKIRKSGKTLVLTTHYMEEAYLLCDRIAIMDHGRIIAMGPPDTLLREHTQGVSIVLSDPRLNGELKDLPWPVFEIDGGFEIQTDDVSRTMRVLVERGVDLTGMVVRSRTLEDLFLKLTGKGLRG